MRPAFVNEWGSTAAELAGRAGRRAAAIFRPVHVEAGRSEAE